MRRTLRTDRWSGTEVAIETTTVVDTSVYSLDALHRACYAFTDRCHIRLERLDADRVQVSFRSMGTAPLEPDFAAQFENALIDHRIRADLHRNTAAIRELIFRQAFVEADL
jgi:His-Xaa-Ser system protein HxsD